jgi:uncharacterized Rmd1/YagE family protein
MLIEIAGEEMHYQVISRARQTVDSGVVALTNNDSQTKTAAAAASVK